ncbi:MAG: ABC transporter permease [Saprospiraceae bacterium]|nr:ABC transporter permease [Bacteroidia bacterium]NNE16764.1 ABC transporter permease [Saprospiraceae bacterium]NNL92321.1 ABC transporter permease [Saprospiraceae bacterium]
MIFRKPENWTMYYKETIRQMYDIGVGSIMIIFVVNLFIGAVTAVQFIYQLSGQIIPKYYIGYIVRDMALIELAVTFTSIILAGKVGSNIASEIGGMRQKEHIDAMEIMGVNTSSYLVMPKLIAALIVIPILVSVAAIVSISGGYIATIYSGSYSHEEFIQGLRSFFKPFTVVMMYIKAVVFAYIITSIACYQGYFVKGGSIELGQASTRAVVFGIIVVLIADYIIAVVLTG